MAKWITKEAACDAVADLWIKINSDESDDPSLLEVQAALRALPAPEPVGEEDLVQWMSASIESVYNTMPGTPRNRFVGAARAALSVVRAHAKRDADPPWKRCADALADEVDLLVRRKVIDSRSPAADALLDYRDPPSSPRADRIAALKREADEVRAVVARIHTYLLSIVRRSNDSGWLDHAIDLCADVASGKIARGERAAEVKP